MDHDRRNLMKGVLTGGTLLALGLPGIAQAAFTGPIRAGRRRDCILLLGHTWADAAFAQGAAAAHAAYAGYTGGVAPASFGPAAQTHGKRGIAGLRTVALDEGLLLQMDKVAGLLARSRGTRWVALMDDASAAIFTEMVRNAGARLLLRGTHAASGDDSAVTAGGMPALRHVLVAASPRLSAGDMLASELVRHHRSFSITENFLGKAVGEPSETIRAMAHPASVPGFRSYRLKGPAVRHLHCSGVPASEGCRLLGWNEDVKWARVSDSFAARPDASAHDFAAERPRTDWVESLGFALTAAALGMEQQGVFPASRGFVHRNQGDRERQLRRADGIFTEERLASFIIDA